MYFYTICITVKADSALHAYGHFIWILPFYITQALMFMPFIFSVWLFTKEYAKSKLEITTVTGPEVSIKNYIPYSL